LNPDVLSLAKKTVELLKQKSLKIATAESCTGGMVSTYITAVSGASKVFEMGLTTYSNRIKNEILKVEKQTLDTIGAVSHDTAKQMAENICTLSSADIGVSVTGVAGPDSQDGYSAGTVFIGLCYNGNTTVKKLSIEPRDRNYVREQAVSEIFNAVITCLS
jgi:nicotinamide-nucleotide amidase